MKKLVNATAAKNAASKKAKKTRNVKLEPFNDEILKELNNDSYDGKNGYDSHCEHSWWVPLCNLSKEDSDAIHNAFLAKLKMGDDKLTKDLPVAARNVVAALEFAQGWYSVLASQYREFRQAMLDLRADYETNPDLYSKKVNPDEDLDQELFDGDANIPGLEQAVWDAVPDNEWTRIYWGCVQSLNDHDLDDRWTKPEKDLIAAEMKLREILIPADEAACNIVAGAVNKYLVATGKAYDPDYKK